MKMIHTFLEKIHFVGGERASHFFLMLGFLLGGFCLFVFEKRSHSVARAGLRLMVILLLELLKSPNY